MTLLATLITDGPSDRVLLPILRWLFSTLTPQPVELQWGDLRGIRRRRQTLENRLQLVVDLYPCHLLLVHRDAEAQAPSLRYEEIRAANGTGVAHVAVVPVRMQEAWLLLDEHAIRTAAGRPASRVPLHLPPARKWESLADPKKTLHTALRTASEARGRRAKRFDPAKASYRVADLVDDWGPLRRLRAFQRLETDIRESISALELPIFH